MTDYFDFSDMALLSAYHAERQFQADFPKQITQERLDKLALMHDIAHKRGLSTNPNTNGNYNKVSNNSNMETGNNGNMETNSNRVSSFHLDIKSAAEIMETEFKNPDFIIENLVPVGLIIGAGRPKTGKSYLSLQALNAVSNGTEFLGVSIVSKFPCFYMALEDNWKRIDKRMREQMWDKNPNVDIVTSFPDLMDGGVDILETLIKEKKYKLVVIDTISRATTFKYKDKIGRDRNEQIKWLYSRLQEIGFENGMAILVIEHHRKPGIDSAQSVIDDVMSDTVKTAVADAVWGLYKNQNDEFASLKVIGRDIQYVDLKLEMMFETMTWKIISNDFTDLKERWQRIRKCLLESEPLGLSHTEIVSKTGEQKGTISKDLGKLRIKGRVVKKDNVYHWIEEIDF